MQRRQQSGDRLEQSTVLGGNVAPVSCSAEPPATSFCSPPESRIGIVVATTTSPFWSIFFWRTGPLQSVSRSGHRSPNCTRPRCTIQGESGKGSAARQHLHLWRPTCGNGAEPCPTRRHSPVRGRRIRERQTPEAAPRAVATWEEKKGRH